MSDKTVYRDCVNWSNNDHCARTKCNYCIEGCNMYQNLQLEKAVPTGNAGVKSRSECWRGFCADSDAAVARFNAERQKDCPFCGGKAEAHWKYDGNYDPRFIIECSECEARVVAWDFETAVAAWNRRTDTELRQVLKETADCAEEFLKFIEEHPHLPKYTRELIAKSRKLEEKGA